MLRVMLLMVQSMPLDPAPMSASGPILPKLVDIVPRCAPSDDDIVICGKKDPEQYRLRPLGPPPGGKPLPPMTTRIGNGTLDLHAEQRSLPGASAPAAMVRFKVPF